MSNGSMSNPAMFDFVTARQKMVDGQVRPSDVTDLRIIDAMLAVPREAFVPAALRKMAYLDIDLDVSTPGAAKRYLIKPVVIARMLQAAAISSTDKVLVVGCATGYIAAVASRLAGQVTATESDTDLAANAAARLAELGYGSVRVEPGPAAQGCVANAPYDVIVLDGATEIEPVALYRQLAPNGRLVGVFAMTTPQRAVLVTRSHDDVSSRPLFDATAPVLPGLERTPAFVF
ncbi:MAG: protein-L-isoaspartate(D-aspartate) O-methyltransferase [Tardiphaga sp.]|nr:protein-L-isoaspartate(D-aspartate) O-methyltransferase [Tardiphaga sp.]